jgi:lipopolysaccharide biosynthesis glycosyltransferase
MSVIKIPVMHCFDNNYSIQAAASMYSMLLHANKSYDYILYVLSTDITSQNKTKLYDVVNRFTNAELEFIDMNNRFDGLLNPSLHTIYTKEVLYKLIAPSIFPQHNILIITDVDVIFLSDISKSYFCFESSTDKLLAGTRGIYQPDSFLVSYIDDYYNKKFDNFSLDKLKVCGGYLVYHLDNMRKSKIEEKFIKYMNENLVNLPQAEQDIINFSLDDNQIEYLPLNYVVCTYMYEVYNETDKLKTDLNYNKNQIIDALKNPIQLHYAGIMKPWTTDYCTKAEIWFDYVSKCGLLKEQMQKEEAKYADEPEVISYCSNIDVLSCVELPEQQQQVMVSVICLTYNHREFIERTLEGIISQETDFDFEVIVSDDASTDGTQDIIRKFHDKYPNKIKNVLRDVNVGIGQNCYEALKMAKGKYLAGCDGDDFWIDSHKLQEQIDFLESNSDYTICCSSLIIADNDKKNISFINDYISKNYILKDYYGFKDLLNCRFIASCTVVMRWKLHGNVPDFIRQYNIIDFPLSLIHAAFGKIKVMNDKIYSQYNIHNQSITHVTKTDILLAEQKMIINEVNQFLDYKFDKTIRQFFSNKPEAESEQQHCKSPSKIKNIIRFCYIELVPELVKKLYRKIKNT